MRRAAFIAVVAAALGSIGLMIRAGGRNPARLVLVLIGLWVISPFLILICAHVLSKSWAPKARKTVSLAMLTIAVGSLTVYGVDAIKQLRPQAAFPYVLTPPVSWLLIAGALLAAWKSRSMRT